MTEPAPPDEPGKQRSREEQREKERASWGLITVHIEPLLWVSGVSIAALGRRFDTSYQTAFRVVKGAFDSIETSQLADLCAVFGVDVDGVLAYDPPADLSRGPRQPPSQIVVPIVTADLGRPATPVRSTLTEVMQLFHAVYPDDRITFGRLGTWVGQDQERIADLAKNRAPRIDYVLLGRLIAFFSRAASKAHPKGRKFARLLDDAGLPTISPRLLLTVQPPAPAEAADSARSA